MLIFLSLATGDREMKPGRGADREPGATVQARSVAPPTTVEEQPAGRPNG